MWKQIEGTEFYVNEKGEVKCEDRLINSHKGTMQYQRLQKGRILKGGETVSGYEFVRINGQNCFRHILVMNAFSPNPNPSIYTDINHKDENPHNNNIENLEWCTHKYNCNYGNRKNGNQDKTKKVAQYDLNGNLIKVYESLRQAEKETNTPKSSGIAHCCRGKQKTYINFKWKYYEED